MTYCEFLPGMSFSLLGWWLSPVEATRAESLHVIDGKFQPALKKQRNLSGFISVWTILQCNHSLAEVKYETWKTTWILRRSWIAPFWDLLVSAPRFYPTVWTEIVAYPGLKICHVIDIVKNFGSANRVEIQPRLKTPHVVRPLISRFSTSSVPYRNVSKTFLNFKISWLLIG
jgi:hypothetical protein